MADAPSSTLPPQQEQATQAASFEATWNDSDASFFKPSAIPVPKAHRAWERQPHSPFTRNGKYRKVWKRYELRSEPCTQPSAANMEEKSPAKSPRKIVKKRALDAPADPTATPGRTGPKNKAFAPTRWETPRRHSGRIASRKIAQPIFAKDPSPELLHADDLITTDEQDSRGGNAEETPEGSLQDQLLEDMQDNSLAEAVEDSEAMAEPPTNMEPESDTAAEGVQVDERELGCVIRWDDVPNSAVEGETEIETAEEPKAAELDNEAAAIHGSLSHSEETTEPDVQHRVEEVVAAGESAPEEASLAAVEPSVPDEPEEGQAGQVQHEADAAAAVDFLVPDEENEARESERKPAQGDETAEVVVDAAMGDRTPSSFSEPQLSQLSVQNDAGDEQAEAAAFQPGYPDAITKLGLEHVIAEIPATDHSLQVRSAVTVAQEGQDDRDSQQQLQTDAAQAHSSGFPPEDEGSLSEEETDESEQLDEDEFTLTEMPDSERDDATNIPSPSLSAAESPRFSAVADTLTLNLPDRTPPKNRTTKDIIEEPASPLDDDTAFLKDFLSRADASKASRSAATARLETITNRQDSDIVRQALTSPRVALENKDPNSPSPANPGSPAQKTKAKDSEDASDTATSDSEKLSFSDITSDLTLDKPAETTPAPAATPKQQNNRRSSRARQTRLPTAPSSASKARPNRIQIRGANGADPVVLRKSEAQEIAAVTRNNTRKNKGGALAAPVRLSKLKAEALKASVAPAAPAPDGTMPVFADPQIDVWQASRLRWDGQLVYFQEQGNLAGLTSLSDNEEEPAETSAEPAAAASQGKNEDNNKKRKDKSGDEAPTTTTPARTKRARGLGAGNGTPAKGLLAPASLLPAGVQEVEKGETENKEKKSISGGKKASASPTSSSKIGTGSKGGKKSDKTTVKEAQLPSSLPPAYAATAESSTALAAKESNPAPTPAPAAPQPPSQLPTPASRRSRLQTPRKVQLPVPVPATSSTTTSKGIPAPPSSANSTASPAVSRLTGSTPRKMTGIAKPAGDGTAAAGSGARGAGAQGLSAGRRRAATAAGRRT